ncbi:hypothetical protein J1N35_038230, partial [Gossypium stocksii]
MSKEVIENVEGMVTRGRARKASRSRDILLASEDRVVTLEESMGDANEKIDEVNDRLIDGLQSMKEQLKQYVLDYVEKLIGSDNAIEAMMTALKEEIAELKGLVAVTPKTSVDVPKPKEFKVARSIKDVDNFLWGIEQYFYAKGIIDDASKEFSECLLQISNMGEKNVFFSFMDGLKPWAKKEFQHRGVQELTKAMSLVESFAKFGGKKD